MKTLSILLSISFVSFFSCTKDSLLAPEMFNINKPGTASSVGNNPPLENIDLNLLKTGAVINLYLDEKNQVTASFDFPKPNTEEVVSWWYQWNYIQQQKDGVKSSTDKTLKYIAYCDSNVLLYIQCTKADGTKSDIIMTSAKVNLIKKQKLAKVL